MPARQDPGKRAALAPARGSETDRHGPLKMFRQKCDPMMPRRCRVEGGHQTHCRSVIDQFPLQHCDVPGAYRMNHQTHCRNENDPETHQQNENNQPH